MLQAQTAGGDFVHSIGTQRFTYNADSSSAMIRIMDAFVHLVEQLDGFVLILQGEK